MKSLWFFHDHALFDRAAPLFSGSVTLNTRRGNEKKKKKGALSKNKDPFTALETETNVTWVEQQILCSFNYAFIIEPQCQFRP